MVSASDYVSALSIPGDFNWPKAVRTLLMRMHMPLLLPITEMVGGHVRPEDGPHDPLAALGGSFMMNLLFRDMLSPLQLYSISELFHAVASQSHPHSPEMCMLAFLGQADRPDDLLQLPDAVALNDVMPQLLDGLDPGAPVGLVPDPGGLEWLPDISFAHVGLPWTTNAFQGKCGDLFALLLNRLSANALPEAWRPAEWGARRASVRLAPGGPEITTPGALIRAICGLNGADVFMQIVSRSTGFSRGFAVKQAGEWLQVPFVVPMRTGLTLLEGVAASSGTGDIVTLMNHAEVALRVDIPGSFSFKIFFYMSIDGTTAWHAGADVEQPWANSAAAEVQHTSWDTPEAFEAAADIAAAVACITNRTADVLKLPSGGYGYLGVCNDSVAIIQAALGEEVTMFPCIVAGHAKHKMFQLYTELQERCEARGDEHFARVAVAVRGGLQRTPCDIVHDLTTAPDAVRRLRAGLPPVTAFEVLEGCRGDLDRYSQQLQEVVADVASC